MLTRRLATSCFTVIPLAALAALSGAASEKADIWVEVRSPHFTVASNGGEELASRVVEQFEQIRAAFQTTLNKMRVDPGQRIIILAAKNENTLKALLPEFWEVKGRRHPPGIFVSGEEKNYVALRLDAEGDNPYQILYHEYVHVLLRLNFRSLPVWLNEGYAEFFGNTRIGEKELVMGEPSRSHIYLLRETRLLPLEVLLKVDPRSPYYNEAEKTSVFYAQSWALVHYLMLDDQMRKEQRLAKFGQLISSNGDEVEAARQAFGDLKQLEKKMESYVRQPSFHYYALKSPARVTDKEFVTRTLPPAESAALRADFHLHMNRMAEARALLDEAVRLDPNLALAHESLGFLHYRQGEREEAAKEFARAVDQDSRSYLAHYYHAMLMVQGSMRADAFPEAEASLQRAVELNPDFAPAYVTLAFFYTLRPETLEKALAAARRATTLEPGNAHYELNVAQVLRRLERFEEARAIARRVLATAQPDEIRAAAQTFLQELSRYQEYATERKRYEEEARASRERLQSFVRAEPAAKPATNSETLQGPAGTAKARLYSAAGKITEVHCTAPAAMDLTLSLGAIVMHLHAPNYFKIDYETTSWKPPENFNPCVHLKGLSAQLSYTLLQGKSYDGEIVSLEVRK